MPRPSRAPFSVFHPELRDGLKVLADRFHPAAVAEAADALARDMAEAERVKQRRSQR